MFSRKIPPNFKNRAVGYSVVEVLAVMAMVGLLMTLTSLGFQQFKASRQLSSAAVELASIIKTTRAFSMANQTYSVIGIRNEVRDGVPVIEVGALYSLDGTEPDETTPVAARGRLHRLSGVHVQPSLEAFDPALLELAGGVPAAQDSLQTSTYTGSYWGDFSWRLLITPSGEISTQTSHALASTVLIGISDDVMRNGESPLQASAAVLLHGATGRSSALYP